MMSHSRRRSALLSLRVTLTALIAGATLSLGAQELTGTRSDVESRLEHVAANYAAAPGDVDARRAYADTLFKLGDIWRANDVMAPLATPESSSEADLELGARLALLTMDLDRADRLYTRLLALAEPGTEVHERAVLQMALVQYQHQTFEKTRTLELPESHDAYSLLAFLKNFPGEPYQISWATNDPGDHIARLPFTNDVFQPGALPEVNVTVGGETLLLTLDTGGDRLYLDVSAADKLDIRQLAVAKNTYAYTEGKEIEEPLGVVDEVELGDVTVRNVPVVVAQWKANGPTTDGVLGTALLKQFLTTIDYEREEITLRPRSKESVAAAIEAMGGREVVRLPFFLSSTHLMFAKGQVNGHEGLNLFLDSGLAATMPVILVDETVDMLGLAKNDIEGTRFYWSPIDSHGLDGLAFGKAQALGNVFVEGDNYRSQGFFWDALISHQYLWKLGSWTIDFDTMSYMFPATSELAEDEEAPSAEESVTTAEKTTIEIVPNSEAYVGEYGIGGSSIVLTVTARDGVLLLQAPGQQPVPMEAYDDGTFGIPLANATITFEGDPSSGVTALELNQRGMVTKAVRRE